MLATSTLRDAVFVLAAGGGGQFNPLDTSAGGNLFWTWIIFLAALYPMWKIVFGPILNALKDRDEQASLAVRKAQEAQAAAEAAQKGVTNELAKARADAAGIMQKASERAEMHAREQEARAREDAERIVEQARQTIEQEKKKALTEIRDEVVQLSCEIAEKALRTSFTDENQKREVAKLIQEDWSRSN